jgi:ABC-type uncharacterized transport system ATPase subunit
MREAQQTASLETAVALLFASNVPLAVAEGVISGEAFLYTLRINAAALAYMCFIIPLSISSIASSVSLDDIRFTVDRGESLCVLGANGSGK